MKKKEIINNEIINSYIIVAKNASIRTHNDYYFSKKFELDKLTKKYYLKEFHVKEDNLNKFTCSTI